MNYFVPLQNMNDKTVVLKDLSIGYRKKHGVSMVATGLNGCIRSGELTCLLGENGVGKSTLLRTLAVFQPPLGGSIVLQGKALQNYTDSELAKTIGVVLTEKPDVQMMTVGELVATGRAPYTGFWGRLNENDHQAVDMALQQVGMEQLKHRLVTTLSDGELQKVMIAKALAQSTPVIYLDEPTAFLDYPSKVDMLLLLKRICREAGKTIFLSTHDLELALQVADTVWLMTKGGKQEETVSIITGTPHELAAQGVLGLFVERSSGVTFNAESMSVSLR